VPQAPLCDVSKVFYDRNGCLPQLFHKIPALIFSRNTTADSDVVAIFGASHFVHSFSFAIEGGRSQGTAGDLS
jgi:hypothetical protein